MATKRFSITISEKQSDWLDVRAEEMGVTKSAMISFAVEQYMRQENAIDMMGVMNELVSKIEKMEGRIDGTEKGDE